jgi:signal transduction histidine kinase
MFPSVAILALAGGYPFTALIVIPYALTFPGAFAPTGLLGADLQSPAWLYNFWHIGSPAAIFAYAVLKDADRLNIGRAPSAWFAVSWTVALAIGLVSLLTWVTTALKQFLPPLFFADAIQLRTVSVSYIVVIQILVAMVTPTALWIRRRSVLDYWLMLVILAFVSEELLFGLFSTTRLSLGWYAGRSFSLASSMFVLVLLLGEITGLYARLARTNMVLERERGNKLMNLEAVAVSISHEIRQPLGAIAANTTANGSLTSPMSGRLRAGSTSQPSSICSRGVWSAGR